LADGSYNWTARAEDPNQPGPWMNSARFRIQTDVPPSAPTGLAATPGNASVSLKWNASPEADVVGYRVYRAMTSGGPYTLVSQTTDTHLTDSGLQNGVTVYYVATAIDAHFESAHSTEVAATPVAPPTTLVAEVRYHPDVIAADCIVSHECRHGWNPCDLSHWATPEHGPMCQPRPAPSCPTWFVATVELPAGYDVTTIDVASVRLAGTIAPYQAYHALSDDDHDGLMELRLLFDFERVARLLKPGHNTLRLSGRAGALDFAGNARVDVLPLTAGVWITPRTIDKDAAGDPVSVHLSFSECVDGRRIDPASLRFNGVALPVQLVAIEDHHVVVKIKRKALAALLRVGSHVEVHVSGTVAGFPFDGVDYVRVKE
jgi:hypothetical protein